MSKLVDARGESKICFDFDVVVVDDDIMSS
jgi:hypothetical protein